MNRQIFIQIASRSVCFFVSQKLNSHMQKFNALKKIPFSIIYWLMAKNLLIIRRAKGISCLFFSSYVFQPFSDNLIGFFHRVEIMPIIQQLLDMVKNNLL